MSQRPAPNQEALWWLQQADPTNSAYNVAVAARLEGDLEVGALCAAFQWLLERHDALRATFARTEDGPALVVQAGARLDFASCAAVGLGDEEARERLADEAARPFDLAAGPPLRVRLYARGHDHLLLVVAHHVAVDAGSLAILLAELAAAYPAFAAGRAPGLPPAPSYMAFARERRAWLEGPDGEAAWAYWRERFGDGPAATVLPGPAGAAPGARPGKAGSQAFCLAPALVAQLRALAAAEGTTLYAVLAAALAVTLGRHAPQDTVVVGAPFAGRAGTRLAGLVGYLTNMVPVRLDLADRPTFRALVRRAGEAVAGAHAHQQVPHGALARRGIGAPRLRAVLLLREPGLGAAKVAAFLAGEPRGGLSLGAVVLTPFALPVRETPFELVWDAAVTREGLVGRLQYARASFEPALVADLATHLGTLLSAAVADPDRPIGALPLASAAERERAIAVWNAPPAPAPAELLHAGFCRQAERAPEAPALVAAGQRFSYGQLAAAAAALAGRLAARGIGPGQMVGIVAGRTPAWVIAQLAVLATGAAFVPLDAGLPEERLAFLGHDAGCALVLVDGAPPAWLAALAVPAEAIAVAAPAGPATWPAVAIDPAGPAYLIYTSGSTGRPKGVLMAHAAAVNTIAEVNGRFGVGPGDRVLAVSSPGFDLSIYDVFGTLAAGGTLVLAPDRASPADWAALAGAHGVTVVNAVPALAALLAEAALGTGRDVSALRLALVSGDRVPLALPARLAGVAPRVRVIALGGATEAGIWSIAQPLDAPDPAWVRVPYGRPLARQQVYVLDEGLVPCPPGVPGEIFIGGASLALGYHQRPELTAARFLPSPFAPGERLYRTGDAGLAREDGTIEILGRLDDQLKRGGVRIEPAEVELALRRRAAVRDACVVLRDDRPGTGRLVAYVVPASGIDGATLEAQVANAARELPSAMRPGAVVVLDALPLTPNGKVDRQALPAPAAPAPSRPPASPRERAIAAAWQAVLGVPVGAEDDFFALGGDSIAALRIVTRLAADGLAPTLDDFFRHPTVAAQAALATRQVAPEREPEAAPPVLAVAPRRAPERASTVLLTGATGFLGTHLLAALLARGVERVVCLVRAPDEAAALARLVAVWAGYGLEGALPADRIVALPGDLAVPGLGLAPERRAWLARSVEAIYHAGAVVNLAYPLEALAATNVGGTMALLALAAETLAKPFHHVSTLAAHPGATGGYARAKWLAEERVREAGRQGLPVRIHRPGEILGDRRTGRTNPADLLGAVMCAGLRLGCMPSWPLPLYVAPVDAVAAAIAATPNGPEADGRSYVPCHRQPVDGEALVALLARAGRPVSAVSYRTWRATVLAAADAGDAALEALAVLLRDRPDESDLARLWAPGPGPADTWIDCPGLDAEALRDYLAAWEAGNRGV